MSEIGVQLELTQTGMNHAAPHIGGSGSGIAATELPNKACGSGGK